MSQPLEAKYVEIDNDKGEIRQLHGQGVEVLDIVEGTDGKIIALIEDSPPCQQITPGLRLEDIYDENGEAKKREGEMVKVEGEPNEVEVGREPILIGAERPSSYRIGRIGSRANGAAFMGLLMAMASTDHGMPDLVSRMGRDRASAPAKKCLLCGRESVQPFCCGDHARLWKEYKKAERKN